MFGKALDYFVSRGDNHLVFSVISADNEANVPQYRTDYLTFLSLSAAVVYKLFNLVISHTGWYLNTSHSQWK